MKKFLFSLVTVIVGSVHAQASTPTAADLQEAIERNDAPRVAFLFREKRLDPNFYLPNGETPLVYAIRVNAETIVNKVILRHRALNVKIPTLRGETALMLAAIKGDINLAQTLIHMGADINVNFGWTALHYAAASGHAEMVSLLIKNGAEINALSERQITPLYMAARSLSLDSVKVLLNAGANRAICNDQGISPSSIAAQRGSKIIADLLVIDACEDQTADQVIIEIDPSSQSQGTQHATENSAS